MKQFLLLLFCRCLRIHIQIKPCQFFQKIVKAQIQFMLCKVLSFHAKCSKAAEFSRLILLSHDPILTPVSDYHKLRCRIHRSNSMLRLKEKLSCVRMRCDHTGSCRDRNHSFISFHRLKLYITSGCTDRFLDQWIKQVQILDPMLGQHPTITLLTGSDHLCAKICQH